jgi:hypothetical protein
MALPNATPSSAIITDLSGTYLEQMLTQNDEQLVFVLGRSYTHSNEFGYNASTGVITPAGLEFDKGVGFYKNANTNRESNATRALWERNNKYVYANKVYYISDSSSSSVKRFDNLSSAPQFVPVIFDYEEEGGELQPDGQIQQQYDGDVYDLSGRKVATEDQVKDGTWKQILRPGIYIVGGKKIKI